MNGMQQVGETKLQHELTNYDQRCASGVIPQACSLCREICLGLSRYEGDLEAKLETFKTALALTKELGCTTCALILDGISHLQKRFPDQSWGLIKFRFNASTEAPLFFASRITAATFDENGDETWRFFQLFTELGQVKPEPIIGAARSIAIDSSSKHCFDTLQSWILACDSHPSCFVDVSKFRLPTRLLDLQPGLDDGVIRLRPTQNDNTAGTINYIALSHCWGPKGLPDIAKTTKATFKDRTQGIRIPDLPKSFQDAVKICQELGIRYLWIDSLCIIQQDAEDWEKECSRMQDVYRNSYLTVSAARSSDSSGGCFGRRADKHRSTIVGWFEQNGERSPVLVREEIDHGNIAWATGLEPDSDCPVPLFSRAWAFQERLLARRVVHYTDTELLWECQSIMACECASPHILQDHRSSPRQLFSSLMTNTQQQRCGPDFRWKWADLVSNFVRTLLSFDADRMPSLSGVAQALHRQDEMGAYLAGLWESELPWIIGWENRSEGHGHRPTGYSSYPPSPPSWSWMSFEGANTLRWNFSEIMFPERQWVTSWSHIDNPTLRNDSFSIVQWSIQSVNCIPLGSHDAYGRVSSGTLVASGLLVPVILKFMEKEQKPGSSGSGGSDNDSDSDESTGDSSWQYFCESTETCIQHYFYPDVPEDTCVYDGSQKDAEHYCFMLGAFGYPSGEGPGIIFVSSLVLRRLPGQHFYERIGIMRQHNHDAWEETPLFWKGAQETVVTIR